MTSHRRILWIAFICMWAAVPTLHAAIPVIRNGPLQHLGHELEWAHDPGGNLGIDNRTDLQWVQSNIAKGDYPAIGYTPDAVWARVSLVNPDDQALDVVMELTRARLSELAWFVLDGDQVVQTVSHGLADDSASRLTRYPMIDFDLPAGSERTVYIRMRSNSSIAFPLLAGSASAYIFAVARRDFAAHLFAGVGIAITLLCLLNAWIQRNRQFLLLAGVVGHFLGYYLIYHGYYVWWGGPAQMWVNRNLMLAIAMLGNTFFLALTVDFARRALPETAWLKGAVWVIWITLGATILFFVLPFRQTVDILLFLLAVTYVAGAVLSGWAAWHERAWHYRLMASVWVIVWLVVLMLFVRMYAWFPIPLGIHDLQRSLMLFIFLVFFAIVTSQQQSVRDHEAKAQRSEQMATTAQLNALRYQLNPHFLFNTLTSIDALSRTAPDRIASLVRKLSVYLRLRLKPPPDGMIGFAQELESMRAYLDIEKVRFGDSMQVEYDVGGDLVNVRIPDMLLQPLMENIIKHGLSEEHMLHVRIRAYRQGDTLQIRMENTGSLQPDEVSGRVGVGVQNVRERLVHKYGTAASFNLFEDQGWVVAELRIPLEEEPKHVHSLSDY